MKDNPIYTAVYVLVLSCVCALLLTFMNESLHTRIEKNKERDHKKAILFATGVIERDPDKGIVYSLLQGAGLVEASLDEPTAKQIDAIYEVCVKKSETKEVGEEETQTYRVYANDGSDSEPAKGAFVGIAEDFAFAGYEDEVRGVLGFHKDGEKLLGMDIYEHHETPGKGAKIAKVEWLREFRGKSIVEGMVEISSTKNGPNIIPEDQVTGASRTIAALTHALNEHIGLFMPPGIGDGAVAIKKAKLDIEKMVEDVETGPTPYPNTSKKSPQKLRGKDYKRPAYMLPDGFKNLALGKPVTTNVEEGAVVHNSLKVITDGNLDSKDPNSFVGLQNWGKVPYAQIDLGQQSTIYSIGVWHYFPGPVYTDVVVQVADDKEFTKNVKTVFNNDFDNSIGLKNLDREPIDNCYASSKYGELIPEHSKDVDPAGWVGRYVRVYSNNAFYETDLEPRFVEIKVWGREGIVEPPTAGASASYTPEKLDIEKMVADVKTGPTPYPNTSKKKPKELRGKDYKRPAYLLPEGFENLARGAAVTTNVEEAAIVHNGLDVITDGNLDSKDPKSFVGLQNWGEVPYAQLDLGQQSTIYSIGLWHYFPGPVYTDIVVQVADDKEFTKNVQTVFNNDFDNSIGLENLDKKPTDLCYASSKYGELIPEHSKDVDPAGWKGRYVRVYSNNAFYEADLEPRFVEIMVWGKKGVVTPTAAAPTRRTFTPEKLDIEKMVADVKTGPTPYPNTSKKKPKELRGKDYKRPVYLLPKGFTNLARDKKVTTNVEEAAIVHNGLDVITDGNLDSKDPKSYVGLQNWGAVPYAQIDLGKPSTIYSIGLWHYFPGPVYTDIVVQVADDAAFTKNVTTVFNNDFDNSIGLKNLDKKPTNECYASSKFGELIPEFSKNVDPAGWKGRYVRVYSNNAFYEADLEPRFVEIMVWGKQ